MWVFKETERNREGRLYTVGHYLPVAGDNLFMPLFDGNWEECARLVNFLNGGEGVFPVKGFYKGIPVSEI